MPTPEVFNQRVAVVLQDVSTAHVVVINAGPPGPANNFVNIISFGGVSFPYFDSVKFSEDFLIDAESSAVIRVALNSESPVIEQLLSNLSKVADNLQLTSAGFDNNLSPEDNTVLKAFEKLDSLDLSAITTEAGGSGTFQSFTRRITYGNTPDLNPNIYYLGNRTGTNVILRSITVWVLQGMSIPATTLVCTVNGGNSILMPNTIATLNTRGKYQIVFDETQPTVDGPIFLQFSHPITGLTAGDLIVRAKFLET